ncbi:MAG TPA: hypothetical protein VF460_05315 [Burkholderiales bacterium]
MNYADGNEARLGDVVAIDTSFSGVVVVSIDNAQYGKDFPEAKWAHLGAGVLIDTDFAGLVHYQAASPEHIVLVSREP